MSLRSRTCDKPASTWHTRIQSWTQIPTDFRFGMKLTLPVTGMPRWRIFRTLLHIHISLQSTNRCHNCIVLLRWTVRGESQVNTFLNSVHSAGAREGGLFSCDLHLSLVCEPGSIYSWTSNMTTHTLLNVISNAVGCTVCRKNTVRQRILPISMNTFIYAWI